MAFVGTVPRNGLIALVFGGEQTLGLRSYLFGHRPQERFVLVLVCVGGQPRGLQILLAWAPSPGTVPGFTGGPTWWAKQVVPGFREVPFDGLMDLGADPRTAF